MMALTLMVMVYVMMVMQSLIAQAMIQMHVAYVVVMDQLIKDADVLSLVRQDVIIHVALP